MHNSYKTDGLLYRMEASDRVSVEAHSHSSYDVLRVIQGDFYCKVEAREYILAPGDIVFASPGERHTLMSRSDGAHARQLIRLDRSRLIDKFPEILTELDKKPMGEKNYIPSGLAVRYSIDTLMSQIHEYASSDRDEAETMLRLCSLMIMAKIGEILKYEYSSGEPHIKKNIKKITDYINENITGAINLDSIARYLYLDKSYICRLFKRETGITINSYVNMRRVTLAKQMMSGGAAPRDTYMRCGYNDYSTFYRAFRRYAGMGPEEFRRGYSDDKGGGEQ